MKEMKVGEKVAYSCWPRYLVDIDQKALFYHSNCKNPG
jgi:hypothetical protein